MANQEITNRNIILNLNDGEEILYVAQKSDKLEFYFFTIPSFFVSLFLFLFLALFVSLILYSADTEVYFYIIFLLVLFIFMSLVLYKEIVDYYFTDVVLTNQRLILYRLNKLLSIEYPQIKYIQNSGTGRGPSITRINLRSKKYYAITFLDSYTLRKKLIEIYPDYNDTEFLEREQKIGNLMIMILALLPVFAIVVYIILHLK